MSIDNYYCDSMKVKELVFLEMSTKNVDNEYISEVISDFFKNVITIWLVTLLEVKRVIRNKLMESIMLEVDV